MMDNDLGRSLSGHATAAEPKVSALRDGIVSAYKGFIAWFGPFSIAIIGIFILMMGIALNPAKPEIFVSAIGVIMILSAMEINADKAKSRKDAEWARFVWNMLADNNEKTFVVNHTFASIRPELNEIMAEEIAKAMETGTAKTEGLGAGHDSAGRKALPEKDIQHDQ